MTTQDKAVALSDKDLAERLKEARAKVDAVVKLLEAREAQEQGARLKIFTIDEWDYFCSRLNFGVFGMDARAIRIMNKPYNQSKDCDDGDSNSSTGETE